MLAVARFAVSERDPHEVQMREHEPFKGEALIKVSPALSRNAWRTPQSIFPYE
jgi:hypothetical protein